MTITSKYISQIVQDGAVWTAKITRRASRKEVVVSKTQSGFATASEAQTWADAELKGFVEHQSEKNKRRNEQR